MGLGLEPQSNMSSEVSVPITSNSLNSGSGCFTTNSRRLTAQQKQWYSHIIKIIKGELLLPEFMPFRMKTTTEVVKVYG